MVGIVFPQVVRLNAKQNIHIGQALGAVVTGFFPSPQGRAEVAVKADGQALFLGFFQAGHHKIGAVLTQSRGNAGKMQPVKAVQQGVQIHFGKVILRKSGVLAVVSNLAGADAVTGFQVIGAQTVGRGFLRGGKDHRGAVHIIGAQPAHRTFAQRVVGHHAEKRAVHAQVGKSQGNVGLAASIAGFKVGSHTDLFIVRRGQAQHDLTNRNKFSRAVVMQEQGVKMFHNIYLSFLAPRAKPGHGPPQGLLCHIYCTVFSSRFQRFLHKLRSYFAFLFTVAQKGRYRAAKNIAHP